VLRENQQEHDHEHDGSAGPDWDSVRARVRQFVEQRIYPLERELDASHTPDAKRLMADLMLAAKRADLWALGHPCELGGQGMPFMDYVRVNEIIGRSHHPIHSPALFPLRDSLMLAPQ